MGSVGLECLDAPEMVQKKMKQPIYSHISIHGGKAHLTKY